MRWDLRHRTTFRYDGPVQDSFNEVRLKPANNHEQRLESFYLTVQPMAELAHHLDFYGQLGWTTSRLLSRTLSWKCGPGRSSKPIRSPRCRRTFARLR